jgi:hypothetical protein
LNRKYLQEETRKKLGFKQINPRPEGLAPNIQETKISRERANKAIKRRKPNEENRDLYNGSEKRSLPPLRDDLISPSHFAKIYSSHTRTLSFSHTPFAFILLF